MKSITFIFFLLLSLPVSAAKWEIVKDETFVPKSNCKRFDTCSLKSFRVKIRNYSFSMKGDMTFGTDLLTTYETDSLATLEDYAIVQFIRGCSFNSYIDNDGNYKKVFNIARQFFDKFVTFNHLSWEIDSIDFDPIYNSSPTLDTRHGYYKWNQSKDKFTKNGQDHLFRNYPTHPKLYVTDLPSQASTSGSMAKNTNLEFKTCLYKTKDIPLSTTPDDIEFAKPIHCVEWKSSNVYNHNQGKFESNQKIERTCKQ